MCGGVGELQGRKPPAPPMFSIGACCRRSRSRTRGMYELYESCCCIDSSDGAGVDAPSARSMPWNGGPLSRPGVGIIGILSGTFKEPIAASIPPPASPIPLCPFAAVPISLPTSASTIVSKIDTPAASRRPPPGLLLSGALSFSSLPARHDITRHDDRTGVCQDMHDTSLPRLDRISLVFEDRTLSRGRASTHERVSWAGVGARVRRRAQREEHT